MPITDLIELTFFSNLKESFCANLSPCVVILITAGICMQNASFFATFAELILSAKIS